MLICNYTSLFLIFYLKNSGHETIIIAENSNGISCHTKFE